MWWHIGIGIGVGLVLVWVLLLIVLWRATPERTSLQEALRLVPDVIRLLRRLAGDGTLPRGVRVRLWLLLAYLALQVMLVALPRPAWTCPGSWVSWQRFRRKRTSPSRPPAPDRVLGQRSLARAAVLVRSRHLTRGRGTPLRSLIHRTAAASPEGWQREPVQYDKSIRV